MVQGCQGAQKQAQSVTLLYPLDDLYNGREDFLVQVYLVDDEIRFIENRDKVYIPTMRILHKYPFMMAHMQCDKGAIKHILSGSDIMCPGLTSAGGKMDDSVKRGTPVAIMAEGKKYAMGVGIAAMTP